LLWWWLVGFDVVVVVDVCREDGDGSGMSEEQGFAGCHMAFSRCPYYTLEWRKHMITLQIDMQEH
jgi:hypothetical protein